VWLTKPIRELRPADDDRLDPPATAYAEPFDTYCDMSHLLPTERGGDSGPRGVAYFCAVLPDSLVETEAPSSVRAGAARFLEREASAIWPRAFEDGAFDWSLIFDPLGREGPERLDAQYFRANVAGTDRYVTTPAGSVDSRLEPGDSGFTNLVLAGDWTRTGIDGGCVEAAVIAGERAADSIVERPRRTHAASRPQRRYVEYGALSTAPGPLLCETARLYCFFVETDRARVQQLCDRVLKAPTGGAVRYRVPRFPPVVLTFGTIAGLRSLHPDHANRGTASEPEAAVWIPTVAQRFEGGSYVDDHLAIFMPYIWVDDPIAFASGREVYGFAKTQGWMRRLDDPRGPADRDPRVRTPDPPEELVLDVYGVPEFGPEAEVQRRRLMTIQRRRRHRSGEQISESGNGAEGADIASLVTHFGSELDPSRPYSLGAPVRRSLRTLPNPIAATRARARVISELLLDQVVRHVFLKQIRDANNGGLAALQQIVEARSSVVGGSLQWRRLSGNYELSVTSLASHPLEDELGLRPDQVIRHAFAAEFGFRMDPGLVIWP
jgi:hypothetical protein